MTTHTDPRTRRWESTVRALRIGVCLQIVCIVLPLLDLWFFGSIEAHVQDAYPDWSADDVALDRNAIAVTLVVVGVLGLVGWFGALWAAARDRAVRATVTTLIALGMGTLMVVAGVGGEPYDQYVPLWLSTTILLVMALPAVTALLAAWFRARD